MKRKILFVVIFLMTFSGVSVVSANSPWVLFMPAVLAASQNNTTQDTIQVVQVVEGWTGERVQALLISLDPSNHNYIEKWSWRIRIETYSLGYGYGMAEYLCDEYGNQHSFMVRSPNMWRNQSISDDLQLVDGKWTTIIPLDNICGNHPFIHALKIVNLSTEEERDLDISSLSIGSGLGRKGPSAAPGRGTPLEILTCTATPDDYVITFGESFYNSDRFVTAKLYIEPIGDSRFDPYIERDNNIYMPTFVSMNIVNMDIEMSKRISTDDEPDPYILYDYFSVEEYERIAGKKMKIIFHIYGNEYEKEVTFGPMPIK